MMMIIMIIQRNKSKLHYFLVGFRKKKTSWFGKSHKFRTKFKTVRNLG